MNKTRWQDWINALLGLWIFVSPWLVQHSMTTEVPGGGTVAMWNLWLVGLAVVVVAGIGIYAFNAWEEWTNLILGAWLLVSPWLLGFSASTALTWNAVIVGALVAAFAAWTLFDAMQGPKPLAK